MEPTDALRSIETALRLVIREVLGATGWLSAPGAPDKTRLEERRTEEGKRRDGALVSNDLLDYTETYHLTTVIEKNWQQFQPVFDDKGRTKAYFGVVEDVRNSVAHSRELVPFERDLISGIAGQMRNQVSLYRSSRTQSTRYYPLIEKVTDNFGREGRGPTAFELAPSARLEVGELLTFTGTAFNARGKVVRWQLLPIGLTPPIPGSLIDVATGDSVVFEYVPKESDVREAFTLRMRVTTDSKYHRHMSDYEDSYDDERIFIYSVNPPEDG